MASFFCLFYRVKREKMGIYLIMLVPLYKGVFMGKKRRFILITIVLLVLLLLMPGCNGEEAEVEDVDLNTEKEKEVIIDDEKGVNEPLEDTLNEGVSKKSKFQVFLDESGNGNNKKEPIWFFEFGSSVNWLDETPYNLPILAKEDYKSIDDRGISSLYISYLDEYNLNRDRYVYGRVWHLEIPFNDAFTEDENHQFIGDLAKYIKKEKGNIYKNFNDEFVFSVKEGRQFIWWGQIKISSNMISYNIAKEKLITVDERIVINTADYKEESLNLSLYQRSSDYFLLDVSCDHGEVYVNIDSESNYGFYNRSYSQSFYINGYHGNRTINLGLLTQQASMSQWTINWEKETKEIILKLKSVNKQSTVSYGEALGAIKVSAEYADSIYARPSKSQSASVNIEHPEFSIESSYLDKTPDGDYLLYLPSGFWDVEIQTKAGSIIPSYITNNVPVNSGEVTLVDIPYPLEASISLSDIVSSTQGIAIESIDDDEKEKKVHVVFSLLDESTQEIKPNVSNLTILESGKLVDLMNVKKVAVPPSIVLLLDSSGSMRGEMDGVLKAAESFIKGLPENTELTIIDFDDEIRTYSLNEKSEGLLVLDKIKAGGDTALYQAILHGHELLDLKTRSTLVLFTDGENDLRGKEKYTNEEFFNMLTSETPIITIGYGKSHDTETLKNMAKKTYGLYFSAENEMILEEIFKSINNRLGSTYKATYKRPKKVNISDIPVMTFAVDASGSMYTEDGEQDSRLNIVKNLLYGFITDLNTDIQVQLMQFEDDTSLIQTVTPSKEKIYSAISKLGGGGGTNIPAAINSSIKLMDKIPSSEKLIVLITDLTLDPENEEIELALKDLKKSGIRSLLVGIGDENIEVDFQKSAEIAGGDYIVTTDAQVLLEKFNSLAMEVEALDKSNLSQVSVRIEKENDEGQREAYGATALAALSMKESGGGVQTTDEIKYLFIEPLEQYDQDVAKDVSGDSIPLKDVIVSKRMPLNKANKNNAVEMTVKELIFLEKLRGVEAPEGYRFMGISLSLENILDPQEVIVDKGGSTHPANWVGKNDPIETEMKTPSYLISNINSHFFVSINDIGSFPSMKATSLLNKPLVSPGQVSVLVPPKDKKNGGLLFLVPDVPIDRLSLQLFDTNYETINLAIISERISTLDAIDQYPTRNDNPLSETFDLIVGDVNDISTLESIELSSKQGLRKIAGGIQSNLYALLDIQPYERLTLEVPTENGSFIIPMNPLTTMYPFGFYDQIMLAPGSYNKILMIFELPRFLWKNPTNLLINLRGENVKIPVSKGKLYPGSGEKYQGEFLDVTINDCVLLDEFDGYEQNIIAVDVTFHDLLDGTGTNGIGDLLQMNDYGEDEMEVLDLYFNSGDYLLALDENSSVYDGESRRGILLYEIMGAFNSKKLYLESDYFKDLKIPVSKKSFDENLFVKKIQYEKNDDFTLAINEAINRQAEYFEQMNEEKQSTYKFEIADVKNTVEETVNIPMPSLTIYGQRKYAEIDSINKLKAVLNEIEYLPSDHLYEPFTYMYSKEAMLTQGFGSANDMANLAMQSLAKLGYSPKEHVVRLTKLGKEKLQRYSKSKVKVNDRLPAISYKVDNNYHMLVLPFIMEYRDLRHLVYIDENQSAYYEPADVRITVTAETLIKNGNKNTNMSDLSDALAGDTGNEPKTRQYELFSQRLPLDDLSLSSLNIGFAKKGNKIKAYVDGLNGIQLGVKGINLSDQTIQKVIIDIDGLEETYRHVERINEKFSLENLFYTLSINSPNLNSEGIKLLQEEKEKDYSNVKNPSDYMSLTWYHRKIVHDLVIGQSLFEKQLKETLNILIGRSNELRIILVTSKALSTQTMETTVDLMQINNTHHSEDRDLITSYNLLNGLYMSYLESELLGEDAYGVFDIWNESSKDTTFYLLDTDFNEREIESLEKMGLPKDVIEHFIYSGKIILLPNQPSVINGFHKWAWLEFDPYSYEVIGRLDTFEKGAMVSNEIVGTIKNAGQYLVGNFVGVNASIWSVAGHTLEGKEYDTVMKEAKAFALGLKNSFGVKADVFSAGIGGAPEISQKIGPVKLKLDAKNPITQDVLGFTQGYEDGVNLYFDLAK